MDSSYSNRRLYKWKGCHKNIEFYPKVRDVVSVSNDFLSSTHVFSNDFLFNMYFRYHSCAKTVKHSKNLVESSWFHPFKRYAKNQFSSSQIAGHSNGHCNKVFRPNRGAKTAALLITIILVW